MEEELSTVATQTWAERGMDRTMVHGTNRSMAESDSSGSFVEAGERACRSSCVRDRDLGIMWPQWHTLRFEGEGKN